MICQSSGMLGQLNDGKAMPLVASDIAVKVAVTPGQVVRYAQALATQSKSSEL